MNLPKKLYCRAFQLGLKIALPFLPYRTPRVIGSIKALPQVIKKNRCGKALLITDEGIRKLGLTRPLETALEKAGIACFVYDKTAANPTTDNAAEAAAQKAIPGGDAEIQEGSGE